MTGVEDLRAQSLGGRLVLRLVTPALALGVIGCALAGGAGETGSCSLVVHAMKAGMDVILEPPYQTSLDHRTGHDDVAIAFSGTGWGTTRVDMAGPGKSVSGTLDPEYINGGSGGSAGAAAWFANAQGTWHFRLASGPCTRVLDVEVGPAS